MARNIPRGWQELEIKDFLRFTPREVEKPKVRYRSLGIRSHCKGTFVRDVENPEKVMMETLFAVKKDDLIVNITFAWEGAVALVNKSDEGALVSHRLPTYVFDRNVVIPEFFRYLIPSKRLVYNLGIISPGGAGRNRVLDRKDFLHLQFVMPPVKEQEGIADILTIWDRSIEASERLIEAKMRLKKGLMQYLLSGKKRLREFPETWQTKSLGDLGECIIGLTYKPDNVHPKGTLVLRSSNINEGQLRFEDNVYVNVDVPDKLIVHKDDILICVRNGSRGLIGKCALINEDAKGMTFGAFMAIFRTPYARFVFYQLQSYQIKKQIHEHLGATINQITNKSLKAFRIPFPKEEKERVAIANILTAIDSEIELMRKRLLLLKSQRISLMQKLLTGKISVKGVTQ